MTLPALPAGGLAGTRDNTPRVRAGVRFALRYSIPVFVMPPAAAAGQGAAALQVRLGRSSTGEPTVVFRNIGRTRAQLTDLQADGVRANGLVGYALAQSEFAYKLPKGKSLAAGASVQLKVNGSPQTFRVDAPAP